MSEFKFTIKNIDYESIELKYNIVKSNIPNNNSVPRQITKLSELSNNTKSKNTNISFLDDSKKLIDCSITIIDFNKDNNDNHYNCFWCRNPFETLPLGCPIKYIPNSCIKQYVSEISKEMYKIKENITDKKLDKLKNNNENIVIEDNKGYYETDGIFCSFNCCKSYILENKHNPLYNISEMLLTNIHHTITKQISEILPAPHWRKLKQYGGDMSIEDFRNSFNKARYLNQGIINNIFLKPTGILFEEKLLLK